MGEKKEISALPNYSVIENIAFYELWYIYFIPWQRWDEIKRNYKGKCICLRTEWNMEQIKKYFNILGYYENESMN